MRIRRRSLGGAFAGVPAEVGRVAELTAVALAIVLRRLPERVAASALGALWRRPAVPATALCLAAMVVAAIVVHALIPGDQPYSPLAQVQLGLTPTPSPLPGAALPDTAATAPPVAPGTSPLLLFPTFPTLAPTAAPASPPIITVPLLPVVDPRFPAPSLLAVPTQVPTPDPTGTPTPTPLPTPTPTPTPLPTPTPVPTP